MKTSRRFFSATGTGCAVALLGALGLGGPDGMAYAQTNASSINLTMEQTHTIKELLKETPSAREQPNVKAEVGERLPQEVSLMPLPDAVKDKVSAVRGHDYLRAGDAIVLVNKERVVDYVIK